MPTKGERQALLFLAAVALLGAGTRACHARRDPVATDDLDRQIGAVETTAPRGHKVGRGSSRGVRSPKARGGRDSSAVPPPRPLSAPYAARSASRVDLDVAALAEMERLPRIGPALAKRIVADRETRGAFGCLAALHAVRGIGPAHLARLESLVTFSGAPRAACAQR